jgi:hypothetical protein
LPAIRITFSGSPPGVFDQPVMPGGSGTVTSRVPSGYRAWFTQSCTWNWIHAAARRLSDVAGRKVSRVSSSRLTTIGFGSL